MKCSICDDTGFIHNGVGGYYCSCSMGENHRTSLLKPQIIKYINCALQENIFTEKELLKIIQNTKKQ